MQFYANFNHFYGALLSLYRSSADRSKFDFVSSLSALRSLSQGAPSLPKWRFAQERRAIERFQRAICPALMYDDWWSYDTYFFLVPEGSKSRIWGVNTWFYWRTRSFLGDLQKKRRILDHFQLFQLFSVLKVMERYIFQLLEVLKVKESNFFYYLVR